VVTLRMNAGGSWPTDNYDGKPATQTVEPPGQRRRYYGGTREWEKHRRLELISCRRNPGVNSSGKHGASYTKLRSRNARDSGDLLCCW